MIQVLHKGQHPLKHKAQGIAYSEYGANNVKEALDNLFTGYQPVFQITDPALNAAVTTAIVNAYSGVIVTTTGAANAQTIQDPTATTMFKKFTVANNDTSTDSITVNGSSIAPGKVKTYFWDGSSWLDIPVATALDVSFTPYGTITSVNVQAAIAELDDSAVHITGNESVGGVKTFTSTIVGDISGQAGTVATITGLAPDTATTQATQPNITSATGLAWTGMSTGTDGEIPTFDASGNPAFVAAGTATHVLTSNGPGAAPTFQAVAAGGLSWGDSITYTSGDGITIDTNATTDASITALDITADGQSATQIGLSIDIGNGWGTGLVVKHDGAGSKPLIDLQFGASDTTGVGGDAIKIGDTGTFISDVGGNITFDATTRQQGGGLSRTNPLFYWQHFMILTEAQTKTIDYDLMLLERSSSSSHASANLTSAGSVLKLENIVTQTLGTLTDSVNVLELVQDADSTGNAINIINNSTSSGIKLAGSGATIEIDSTPDTDHAGSGMVATVTVDVNATGIGAPLYMAADGNYEEADASSASTSPCTALAMETGTGAKKVLLQGYFRDDTWNWATLGSAGLIYLDTTTGALTQTAPSGSGDQVQVVGHAVTADIIYFNPDLTLIELT